MPRNIEAKYVWNIFHQRFEKFLAVEYSFSLATLIYTTSNDTFIVERGRGPGRIKRHHFSPVESVNDRSEGTMAPLGAPFFFSL